MMQNDRPESKELAPLEATPAERLSYPRPPKITEIDAGSEEAYSYVRAYWRMLVRHAWTILTVAFVVAMLTALISFRLQPVYQATARVEIEAATPEIRTLSDLFQSMPADDMFLQTQVNVLESDNLAWQTIEQLRLGQNPAFATPPKHAPRPGAESVALEGALLQTFKGRLHVEIMRNSRIAAVSFESTDPKLAASVVNALVGNYEEYNYHKNYEATRKASGWMEQQLDELKAKVEKSQQALVDYERDNKIINISDKENVEEKKLGDLSKELTDAQAEAVRAESLYNVARNNEGQVASLVGNDLLSKLEEKYAELKSQYVEAREQYGPNFPKVVRLGDQAEEIRSSIEAERKRIVERYHGEYVAAQQREAMISEALA